MVIHNLDWALMKETSESRPQTNELALHVRGEPIIVQVLKLREGTVEALR